MQASMQSAAPTKVNCQVWRLLPSDDIPWFASIPVGSSSTVLLTVSILI
jgi:hypothetical protein